MSRADASAARSPCLRDRGVAGHPHSAYVTRPTSRRAHFRRERGRLAFNIGQRSGTADQIATASGRGARERDDLFAKMGDVNDPFYLVKEEIQGSVDKAKGVTERMDRLPEHNGERVKYANAIVTECDP